MKMLLPSQLATGEDFASVEDLLLAQDLAEATVHVPHWKKHQRPLALRVRALSLEQQDDVRMRAARAVRGEDRERGVKQHWPTFVVTTIWQGCIVPTLTFEQAAALARKNARAAELVSNFIWLISAVDQEQIDVIVADLARADGNDGAESAPPVAGDPGMDAGAALAS